MALGSAYPAQDEPSAEIRGRDLVSGLPKTVVISAAEVRNAIAEPLTVIVDAVRATLDKCPPSWPGRHGSRHRADRRRCAAARPGRKAA